MPIFDLSSIELIFVQVYYRYYYRNYEYYQQGRQTEVYFDIHDFKCKADESYPHPPFCITVIIPCYNYAHFLGAA